MPILSDWFCILLNCQKISKNSDIKTEKLHVFLKIVSCIVVSLFERFFFQNSSF